MWDSIARFFGYDVWVWGSAADWDAALATSGALLLGLLVATLPPAATSTTITGLPTGIPVTVTVFSSNDAGDSDITKITVPAR